MNAIAHLPKIRFHTENENHHLWNNHGTWFLHYTVHPTPYTKARVRRSLGTRDVNVARVRRDSFFERLGVAKPIITLPLRRRIAA